MSRGPLLVACLCAAWCRTCDEVRPMIDELARRHPGMCWRWIDIEDEDALLGELDIETFPTLMVASRSAHGEAQLRFGGVVAPRLQDIERLVLSIQADQAQAAQSGAIVSASQRADFHALAVRLLADAG